MPFPPRILLILAASLFGAAALSSCSITRKKGAGLAAYQAYDLPAKLPSDPDQVRVKVSLGHQRAYVLEGDKLLLAMPVTVGSPKNPTPSGNFRITEKTEKKRAKLNGYAWHGEKTRRGEIHNTPRGWKFTGTPLPYWCGFKPGYGFHTGWIKHFPSTSDGCIRMHENIAPKFFRLVKTGTPVDIAYSQPEDARFANIPLPPDAGPLPDYDGKIYISGGYFHQHKEPVFD